MNRDLCAAVPSMLNSAVWSKRARVAIFTLVGMALMAASGCGGAASSPPPPPTPDFSVSVSGAVSLAEGGSQTIVVSSSSLNGFSGPIEVSFSGLPAGVSVSPATFMLTANGLQAVTFSASSSAAAANAIGVTVQGTSGSLAHTTTVQVTVLGPPSFTLSVQPTTLTMNDSSSQIVSVAATGVNGFAGQVTVNVTGLPAGVTAAPNPFNVQANTSYPLTLTTSATASGSSTVQFSGTSGSVTASTSMALTINTAPDFSISPGTYTGLADGVSNTWTIGATAINGFSAPINFSLTGLPTGVTASPATFTLNPGSTQQVTFTAALNAPPETSGSVTVQAVSGSISHTSSFPFAVSAPSVSVSLQPSTVTIPAGSTAMVEVQVTGTYEATQGNITGTVTGVPAGVTASPSSFTVAPNGGEFDLYLTAAASGASGGTVTVQAQYGTAKSSASFGVTIGTAPVVTAVPLGLRTRLLRTDSTSDYAEFPPPNWTVYHSDSKRFFASDYGLGRVNVIDSTTQKMVTSIAVPGAFGMDLAPDGSVLYVGTASGDLYVIDPVGLTIVKRYSAASIGPNGFAANAVYALANGKFLLQQYFMVSGYSWVDGNGPVALWNPADNSLVEFEAQQDGTVANPNTIESSCYNKFEFGVLTNNRTRFLMTPTLTSQGSWMLCSLDPNADTFVQATLTNPQSGDLDTLAVSPDGNTVAAFNGTTLFVLDAATLTVKNSFSVASSQTSGYPSMMIGPDNETVYITGAQNNAVVLAYDLTTGQETGWLPTAQTPDASGVGTDAPQLQAMSDNGLLGGTIDQGFVLVDTTKTNGLPVGTPFGPQQLEITAGPVSGGTADSWLAADYGPPSAPPLGSIYFGANAATDIDSSTVMGDYLLATTPPGTPGPVDVVTLSTDGGEQFIPEGFSYGPSVVESPTKYATAEGGGTASVYGYGFGASYFVGVDTRLGTVPSDLQMTVGGASAPATAYYPEFYLLWYPNPPYPLQDVEYTMPAGVAGTRSDLTITNGNGTTTDAGAITYLPAVQSFPVDGQLLDGLYDARRDVYYFTDVNQVRVFSRTQGKWLDSIAIPSPAGAYGVQRLFGLALSPDGTKLAVSDAGAFAVYIIDPDNPASIQSFTFSSQMDFGGSPITTTPSGIAITNSGQVWFATFDQDGDGAPFLYHLDPTTGQINIAGGTQAQLGPVGYPQNEGNLPYGRLPMSADGSTIYFANEGEIGALNTATGAVSYCESCADQDEGGFDIVLTPDGTGVFGDGLLLDTSMNFHGIQSVNYREIVEANFVYGAAFSGDGRLLFQPGTQNIDIYDGQTGAFVGRVSLGVPLSPNYRALVSDGKDNVLVAITGQNGDGIAVIDLSSVPSPAALSYPHVEAPRAPEANVQTAGPVPQSQVAAGVRSKAGLRFRYTVRPFRGKVTTSTPGRAN